MPAQQVWLITGTSSGFGEALVQTLLERGEKVIATARTPSKIEHLAKLGAATLQLDVTASPAELDKIAEKAVAIYGKVDVLVNNAGYFHFGTLEEATYEGADPMDVFAGADENSDLRTGKRSSAPTCSVRSTPHVPSCRTSAVTNRGQ